MAISYQWCFLLVGMVPWIMGHVCRSFGKQSWQLDRRPIDGDQTKPPRNAPWIQKVSFFSTFMSILGEKCSTMWMFSATVSSVISYLVIVLKFLFFHRSKLVSDLHVVWNQLPVGTKHDVYPSAVYRGPGGKGFQASDGSGFLSCPVDVLAIPSEEEKYPLVN